MHTLVTAYSDSEINIFASIMYILGVFVGYLCFRPQPKDDVTDNPVDNPTNNISDNVSDNPQ